MHNLEQMDKFLERYNLPSLNQEEIENMNKAITSNEFETGIKNLPTNKSLGSDGFTGEFYQTFREELTLLTLFQKNCRGRNITMLIFEATITLMPKPDKDITKNNCKADITDEHRCQNPKQNTSKPNPTAY